VIYPSNRVSLLKCGGYGSGAQNMDFNIAEIIMLQLSQPIDPCISLLNLHDKLYINSRQGLEGWNCSLHYPHWWVIQIWESGELCGSKKLRRPVRGEVALLHEIKLISHVLIQINISCIVRI
jgi:hypothetical protein